MTITTSLGYIPLSTNSLRRANEALGPSVTQGIVKFDANGVLTHTGQVIGGKAYLAVVDELVQKKPKILRLLPAQIQEATNVYNDIVTPKPELISKGAAILGFLTLTETALSFTRCVLGLQVGWEEIVESTGVLAGVLFVTLGSQDFAGARADHAVAYANEHSEKYCKAAAKFAAAIVGLLSAILYLLGKLAQKSWIAVSAEMTSVFLEVSNAFAGIGLIIAGVLASYGIHRCHVFADRLKSYQDPKDQVSYLLNAVTVSDAEKAALGNDSVKIAQRQNEKIEYVRARTSMKAVRMILDKAPALLERLNTNDPSAIQAVNTLRQSIIDEGTKKQLVYTLGLIATILSFLSVVLGTFATAGAVPSILFAAAITIKVVLMISSSSWFVSQNDPIKR